MFIIPSMKNLVAAAKKLPELYQTKRDTFDEQRFFAFWRAKTVNPMRIEDANFVKSLAEHVLRNKFTYATDDKDFRGKDYNREVVPFLKYAITGAMLLELMCVSNSYTFESSVQVWSALGAVVLEQFGISKLSEVPKEELEASLAALGKYLQVYSDQSFHPSKSNAEILAEISPSLPTVEVNSGAPAQAACS